MLVQPVNRASDEMEMALERLTNSIARSTETGDELVTAISGLSPASAGCAHFAGQLPL